MSGIPEQSVLPYEMATRTAELRTSHAVSADDPLAGWLTHPNVRVTTGVVPHVPLSSRPYIVTSVPAVHWASLTVVLKPATLESCGVKGARLCGCAVRATKQQRGHFRIEQPSKTKGTAAVSHLEKKEVRPPFCAPRFGFAFQSFSLPDCGKVDNEGNGTVALRSRMSWGCGTWWACWWCCCCPSLPCCA